MDISMIIEVIGYVGSVLVVVSMLMSSLVKLRVMNSIGAGIFACYALMIHSYPTALMNFCLVLINIYNLVKLKKMDRHYDLVTGEGKDSFLEYALNHYKEDIKIYYPEFNLETMKFDVSYIVCCDSVPAGFFLGSKEENGEIVVLLDYSTPAYRDCSVGMYLYSQLEKAGVKKLTYKGNWDKTTAFLDKVGCVKENGVYVKHF